MNYIFTSLTSNYSISVERDETSVGPVPETSVPIRFRVLQFEDRFNSGSYLTSRPRFRVGSGRVNGSSICICDNTIFNFLGDLSVKNIRPVPYVKRI